MMRSIIWRPAACLILAILAGLGIAEWAARRRTNDTLWAAPLSDLPATTQALTWPTVAHQRRVVVLGDSIAAGWELPAGAAWPDQLQGLLEHDGDWRVINAGIPGETAAQGLARTARDANTWRPHVVLIAFGLNDGMLVPQRSAADRWRAQRVAYGSLTGAESVLWLRLQAQLRPAAGQGTGPEPRLPLESYQAALRAIVGSIRQALPDARVAFLTLTPVTAQETIAAHTAQQRLAYTTYAAALADVATQIEVPVIDVYTPLAQADPACVFLADGLHLTAYGQRLVAKTVYDALF